MKKIALFSMLTLSLVASDCILGQVNFKDNDGSMVNIKKACFEGKMFLIKGGSLVQVNGVDCTCPETLGGLNFKEDAPFDEDLYLKQLKNAQVMQKLGTKERLLMLEKQMRELQK